jgi:hypothetical protein
MKLFKAQWGANGPIAVVALGLFSIASLVQDHALMRPVSIAEDGHIIAASVNVVISGAPRTITSAPFPKAKRP